jgi:hypothetical protein
VSNETRHVKTLNEFKEFIMSIIIIIIIQGIFPSHADFFYWFLESLGETSNERFFFFFSFVQETPGDVWFVVLIHGVTTIYHQATGMSIFPASMYLGKIALDI